MIQRFQVGDQLKAGFYVRAVIRGGMGIIYVLQYESSNLRRAVKSCDSERAMLGASFSRGVRDSGSPPNNQSGPWWPNKSQHR